MKMRFFSFLLLLPLVLNVSAQQQVEKAQKITELVTVSCGQVNAYVYQAYAALRQSPEAKIYVIFYGQGRGQAVGVWNRKTKQMDKKLSFPHPLDALNRAKEVPLYLKTAHNLPADKVVLIDGGFREDFEMEIWLVPNSAEPPSPTPTIDGKGVKFRKGKAIHTRDCARAYDMYEDPNF